MLFHVAESLQQRTEEMKSNCLVYSILCGRTHGAVQARLGTLSSETTNRVLLSFETSGLWNTPQLSSGMPASIKADHV